jgi:hypothetical protein
LGPTTNNQITAIFERPIVMGVSGTATPFSLIADSDVVDALVQAVRQPKAGTYNLAGDGTLSLREIAELNHRPYISIPPWLLKSALWLLHLLRLTTARAGPRQVHPVPAGARQREAEGRVRIHAALRCTQGVRALSRRPGGAAEMTTLVIGAGPAGLAAIKSLKDRRTCR